MFNAEFNIPRSFSLNWLLLLLLLQTSQPCILTQREELNRFSPNMDSVDCKLVQTVGKSFFMLLKRSKTAVSVKRSSIGFSLSNHSLVKCHTVTKDSKSLANYIILLAFYFNFANILSPIKFPFFSDVIVAC